MKQKFSCLIVLPEKEYEKILKIFYIVFFNSHVFIRKAITFNFNEIQMNDLQIKDKVLE